MKAVWITCSVLCVCGLICSGVLFVMGRSLLGATKEAKAAADEYALSTVTAVCRKWDKDELNRQLDSTAAPGLADAVVAAGKPLGSLREASPFVATAMEVSPEHGSKSVRVTVRDTATFEHGSAQLKLKVVYLGEAWKIREFQITPTSNPAGATR